MLIVFNNMTGTVKHGSQEFAQDVSYVIDQ